MRLTTALGNYAEIGRYLVRQFVAWLRSFEWARIITNGLALLIAVALVIGAQQVVYPWNQGLAYTVGIYGLMLTLMTIPALQEESKKPIKGSRWRWLRLEVRAHFLVICVYTVVAGTAWTVFYHRPLHWLALGITLTAFGVLMWQTAPWRPRREPFSYWTRAVLLGFLGAATYYSTSGVIFAHGDAFKFALLWFVFCMAIWALVAARALWRLQFKTAHLFLVRGDGYEFDDHGLTEAGKTAVAVTAGEVLLAAGYHSVHVLIPLGPRAADPQTILARELINRLWKPTFRSMAVPLHRLFDPGYTELSSLQRAELARKRVVLVLNDAVIDAALRCFPMSGVDSSKGLEQRPVCHFQITWTRWPRKRAGRITDRHFVPTAVAAPVAAPTSTAEPVAN